MSGVQVPKSMDGKSVVWAFRHGVVEGMRTRGRVIPRQGHGYVIAQTNVLRLADRVRIEWTRRHQKPVTPEGQS